LIKERIQPQVNHENIVLSSFIISNTKYYELPWKENRDISEFHHNNVFFQYEDKDTYVGKVIAKMLV
jgi:hypothetical protein